MTNQPAPSWLADAVLYQIYPQTFADSDGDGIGDLAGITEHLDHLAWLGVDAVWLNPCFESPFRDAGYDVTDYLRIAPRYGTQEDLAALVEAAGRRGIRILLDLVPGHTSDRHPWFLAAADDPTDQRYIWADRQVPRFVPSPGKRPGYYLPNFFDFQPALNFGYARSLDDEPWRQPVNAEGPQANRAALREIMDHWLPVGVAGFRVDMAYSLVKDDPGRAETSKLWREQRAWLDRHHPEAVLLAEWGRPELSLPAGFHADFLLHFAGRAVRSLWDNGEGMTSPSWEDGTCYFDPQGRGSMDEFLAAWRTGRPAGGRGHVILPTANHDYNRLATGSRTPEQLRAVYAFLMTWPTLPAIYYGDEIGMRFVPGLPDKEGSRLEPTNNRAGSRTPMQWDDGPNAGFSTAPAGRLYQPLDPDPGRPTVASQLADPDSLLNLVQRLIALRRSTPALGSRGAVEVLNTGYPFVHLRGGTHLVVVNPRREPAHFTHPGLVGARALEAHGISVTADGVHAGAFAYGIFELSR
ncbi:alpha-amylase family glycosyl hydrolase [Kitasatospora sp. GP82]|uniref:alpha-amylase family glycosyl hydrolase n=1 Tax=Kitasatospora sp. GP82 TaxID=3035089 RepID=UPI002476254A|nr:alpha-amylase family glycosyl hydrolase [Kitasatospora sp. GP82]MDH6124970.1 glycosidase [Kitasatospora sp. GP82]